MIVAVSDIHLGYEKSNKNDFKVFITDFLEKENIEHLVLLGDILDFWRRLNEGVMLENNEILHMLGNLKMEKHFVVGNHDFCLSHLSKCDNLPFEFTDSLVLKSGQKRFRFIHGFQIEFANILPLYKCLCQQLCGSGDEVGKILSNIWARYEKLRKFFRKSSEDQIYDLGTLNNKDLKEIVEFISKSPEERKPLEKGKMSYLFRKELMNNPGLIAEYDRSIGLKPGEILVYGHTHNPVLKEFEINTGSWVQGDHRSNSYVVIDEGKAELKYWE
jgi:UDP-2,3-diacylglucosamine pyrophosphatase LpxH